MLGKLFKKKGKGTPGLAAPARTLEQSDDLIDQDETIVIDLTSDAHLKPEDIRLHLDDVQPAVDAPAEPTVFRPQGPAESLGPAEHEDTQIWTGQSFQPAPARESPEVRQAAKPAAAGEPPSAEGEADSRLIVGWLVVTSANGRGVTYPVRLGRNKLGRGEANAISVRLGDSAISKDGHLTIAADPRSKRFYAIPGDSTNLAYLDDQPLLEAREIADKSLLQAGNTVFVFVQFAGNYVDWE